ncbi:cilia- and flagella-associated protein 46-like isoform X4 [Mytilus californianus]|uniref:cilia- and flagella-associated protein 46-like isoform X4 n=1 Tax=Mytilus californianus TaxID=6549 RepID=UPI0022476CD0|nr:cilia- and flagella-associated protein 46-like isoform X4 [Mytilus californianus]
MDTSIRTLLAAAQKHSGPEKNQPLHQAYSLLRNVAESKPAIDAPESFGPDLYVICAETAFQNGLTEMARECLKMYFMKPPPGNQFLCRAYLCQAQLLAPKEANDPEQLEKAVVYLIKAINFAKNNPRYHFLVYNASVIYWQFCRPFLKPRYRQYLAHSLHQVVKALDDIDDQDFEWRAQLMIALIECHLDAGKKTDATGIAGPAASFIKQNVPQLYKQVFGLIVRNQLLEAAKLHKDVKNSPELAVYYKILKLKVANDISEPRDYYSEMQHILNQMGVPQTLNANRGKSRASRPTTTTSPAGRSQEEERLSASSSGQHESRKEVSKYPSKTPVKGRRTPTPTSTKKLQPESLDNNLDVNAPDRPYLLLELARFCLELDFPDLAQDCVDQMKNSNVKDPGFFLELEFLQSDLTVKSLGDKQESYQKSSVDVRLQAIKRCEETMMNAIRNGDPNVIQAGCVTTFNLCLPLIQSNLRKHIRKPLTLLAEALEGIHSLLINLRCQIHTELSKCEEDQEQIQVAMDHLKKAIQLDDGSVYKERLEVALHRLELRAQLYKQPDRPEDMAAMIIEQARKADSGTMRMKRSLLVKAGEALAPDAFQLVLDSESDTKEKNGDNSYSDVTGGKAPQTQIKKLANKARQFNKCVKKAEGHLKRLGDENDRERARLWGDLAKTARKQEVWDVCRVAARFCLLYDDDRWKNVSPIKQESPKPEKMRDTGASVVSTVPEGTTSGTDLGDKSKADSKLGTRPSSPERPVPLYDKDLIRMLAEVQFIQGEAMVHLLRTEGVELNDMPIPPVDKSKRPKGYVAKKPEEDPDWLEYCDWIQSLSQDCTKSFLRGLDLGVELEEPWLVCCATAYIWNYNNHVLTQNRHREIMDPLMACFEGLKKVGHAGETVMLVNVCGALAFALMKPWIPDGPKEPELPSPTPSQSPASKKGGKAPKDAKNKPSSTTQISISPDALPDLKKAIEVCEYAIEVTNGNNPLHVIPMANRLALLQTWVAAKQMAQQQIAKTFGADDEPYTEGQRQMTRAIVAVEMLHLSRNGILEFKDTPPVAEIASMIEECKWADKFVELQLWARLTYLSYLQKNHTLVMRCSKNALRFAVTGTQPKGKKIEAHRYLVEQEMLSYASGILGQSLMDNMAGKNAIRREAMEAFLNSARYARNADNYEMVMTAARHYWNACVPLVSQPIERELLREPIKMILQCITATAEKIKKKEEKQEGEGEENEETTKEVAVPQKSQSTIGSPEDDLTLRASMYGVLFQSFADKKQWEEGLRTMDQAINDMPRTKHRLLIFKHRVMTKAKLGRSVNMDIQKFKDGLRHVNKDESEDYVAHMWRRVALSSKETLEQLISYQAAIEALNSPSNEWLKVDLLIEFGQWLYSNEFPLQDAIDQIEWAVDIILNMKTETDLKKEQGKSAGADRRKEKSVVFGKKGDKGKPKGRSSAKSRGAATPVPTQEEVKKVGDGTGSDTRSITSDSDSELNPEGIVPVTKQAIIGVLPANTSLTVSDLEDVRQIDSLIRTHILLAELAGHDSPCYKDYLLMAQTYILRLLQVTVSQTGPVIKEIAKNPPAQDPKATSAKGKKGGKEKEAAPPKEKPKRKGPLDILPSTVEEWSIYDIPEEVMEAFNHDMMKTSGINNTTIVKPMLTMYYLDQLLVRLRGIGYNHLTFPILVTCDILSRNLLKNNPLYVLVHSRASEICLELNLKNGYSFHEKLAGPVLLNEDDQALSRDEIALWKEKQIQVAREEMRVKESLARLKEEAQNQKKTPQPRTAPSSAAVSKVEDQVIESHLGKVLSIITYREVWTDTAELLIRQCNYQAAREYLNEAFNAALAFEDKILQAKILYFLGKLSLAESQHGQAFNFCQQAQAIHHGDEMFWYETTMLMVDATLHDYESRNCKRIARGVLIHGLNEFMRICDERPNRNSVTAFIVAMMEAKLAEIQTDIIFEDEERDLNDPKVMKAVLTACEKFESASEKLIMMKFRREVLPIMKKHAGVLQKLARKAIEKEICHTYYLQGVMVLKEAVCIAEEAYQDVLTLLSLQEVRNLSLPIQRELADIKICCGELMLEMFQVHSKEMRNIQLQDMRKGSVMMMVEDFIRTTPHYTHMEKEWVDMTKVLGEDAILKFEDAHNLGMSVPRIRARALCCLGQTMRAYSTFISPDPPTQWLVHEMELEKVADSVEEEEKEEKPEVDMASKNYIRYSKQIKDMKDQDEVSRHYMLQASECLVQALNLSLQKGFVDIAGTTSLELVDCYGQYDPQSASQFLALFQSCSASQTLKTLLSKAQVDPRTSKLAALLHQRDHLIDGDLTANLSCGSLMSTVQKSLDDNWQAWKRLIIQPNHLDILKEFPANFNFIILQHSPDRSYLYGALLDKPKAQPAGGKNPKAQTTPVPSRSKVYGVETSPQLLDELLTKFADHKQSVQQLLLKQEYQRAQAMMRQKMLENLDESLKKSTRGPIYDEDDAEEEARLQEEFKELLNDMEAYLKPITAQLTGTLRQIGTSAVRRPEALTPASNPNQKASLEPPPSSECVILLADPMLMQMPLEALQFLQLDNIISISRDFSLQMFNHRGYKEDGAQEETAGGDKKKPKSSKTAENPLSRIPGMRDASKRTAKIIPLSRDVPSWCHAVDTHNFRYFVDTHLDSAETEENKPVEVFQTVLEEYDQQFTARWLGVMGDDHAPSVGEWEIYLAENSSFVFYGMEKFIKYIPPEKLTALNIPECSIVYLLDMAQTSKSFTRQSKLDVLKSSSILNLEKPVEMAMLTSLTGIKCLMTNQWHCTLAENANKLKLTMKDLLEGGKTPGETVRYLLAPNLRPKKEEATDAKGVQSQTKGEAEDEPSEFSYREAKEALDSPELDRSQYNMVVYGLPNIVVVQQ